VLLCGGDRGFKVPQVQIDKDLLIIDPFLLQVDCLFADELVHVRGNLGQPGWVDSQQVLHVKVALGALLHLPEE
jgi:hypothetical protein